jgi:predicted nucleotidyltransferase
VNQDTILNCEQLREGDFLKTSDNLCFEVRGNIHPPKYIIAFLRYVQETIYRKAASKKDFVKVYNLAEREKILKKYYPHYLKFDKIFGRTMQEVPYSNVVKIYNPISKLEMIIQSTCKDNLEKKAYLLTESILKKTNLEPKVLGITGSLLLNLHRRTSDIDMIVYGKQNANKVNVALRHLLTKKNDFTSFNKDELLHRYRHRGFDELITFKEFAHSEQRKAFQGFFQGTEFFIRYVRDSCEVESSYGDTFYQPKGEGSVNAVIVNDDEALLTPCKYFVSGKVRLAGKKEKIQEIMSFRGRFCDQATIGERVKGYGTIEKVTRKSGVSYYRVIIGEKRNHFLIVVGNKQ